MLRQEGHRRTVCHLLHYVPQRRAADLDILDDAVPLYDRALAVRCEARPARAYLAPQGTALDVAWREHYAVVCVPVIVGRQFVVFADDGRRPPPSTHSAPAHPDRDPPTIRPPRRTRPR